MKSLLKIWFVALLLAVFASGCGCGGGGEGAGETMVNLVSIEVTPEKPSIGLGTHQQFMATGIFSNNTRQDITTTVTWSSEVEAVATISNEAGSKGLAVSTAVGSTTITATTGTISGSTTLTVTPATLVSISVLPANPSIGLGTTLQLTALGTFSDNTTQDITTSVDWTSSDNTVATIGDTSGSKGSATALAAGSTTIVASSGGISSSTVLTVSAVSLVSISVTPQNKTVRQQSSVQYSAMGTFSDNTTQDITASVIWSSSNTAIAAISNAAGSKGLAIAVGPGSTTITASLGDISGSTSLTVSPATLVSIAVTPAITITSFDTNIQYKAIGTYSDNTTEDLTQVVTWSSSNPSIATISNEPGSKGLATTDHKIGSTTITATLGGISGSAILTDP